MNKKTLIWVIVIAVILIVLFYIPKLTDPTRAIVSRWNDAGIDCLPSNQNTASHIHPVLRIRADGRDEMIPANIGIVRSCMAEIHTHDTSGTLHVESVLVSEEFTLSDFFNVWGENLERPGLELLSTVDNATTANPAGLIFRDRQLIILDYSSE